MLQNHPSVKKHKKQMENICNKSYVIKYAQDYICNNLEICMKSFRWTEHWQQF